MPVIYLVCRQLVPLRAAAGDAGEREGAQVLSSVPCPARSQVDPDLKLFLMCRLLDVRVFLCGARRHRARSQEAKLLLGEGMIYSYAAWLQSNVRGAVRTYARRVLVLGFHNTTRTGTSKR